MDEQRRLPAERYRPFVYVFVPFSIILAVGNLLYSELSPNSLWGQFFYPDPIVNLPNATTNLTLGRVVFSIQLTMIFSIPALVLFALYNLRTAPPIIYRYWQLFWTFGFLGYAIHTYYTTGAWFEWDFAQIIRRQTWLVTIVNYLLFAIWGCDVLFSVFRGQGAGGTTFYRFQWFTHLLYFIAAVTASIVFSANRSLESYILGWVVAVTFGFSLISRILFGPVSSESQDPMPMSKAGNLY
jgi:hypothetical protein